MANRGKIERPIWAKWQVSDDGSVRVVATYATNSGYEARETCFASLDQATAEFGDSLGAVIRRALQSGSRAGRWRP